jgi:hypothetical protein
MLLRVNGQAVAAQLCFVDRGQLYLYYSGFDPAWACYGGHDGAHAALSGVGDCARLPRRGHDDRLADLLRAVRP